MYLTIKNVKLKEDTSYRIVSKSETLLGTDLMRSTIYPEDYYNSDLVSRMNWDLVRDGLTGWVGRSIEEYEKRINYKSYYEIIRIVK